MELKLFSNSSIEAIQQQALHHIFLADDFLSNIESVKDFEKHHEVLLTNLIDIYYYLCGIAEDNLYHANLRQNVLKFIDYYWKKQKILKVENYNVLTLIQNINSSDLAYNSPCHTLLGLRMTFESFITRKAACCFQRTKSLMDDVFTFYSSIFEFTKAILSSKEKDTDFAICNDLFLSYCNYLINTKSSLLLEQEYFLKIRSLLYANMDYSFQTTPNEVSEHFFKENSRVLKRMEHFQNWKVIYYQ